MDKPIRIIAHLADIHIPKLNKRHREYRTVFNNTIKMLQELKPDRIVIVGDLYHDKLNVSNEANKLAAEFLHALSEIAPVIITRGNHDFNILRKDRIDCIQTLVDLIRNPRINYLNTSGFYVDKNVIWTVWHHGDHFSPWNELTNPQPEHTTKFYSDDMEALLAAHSMEEIRESHTFIDLYHDPVNGCKMFNGMELTKDSYLSVADFQGDYAMLGDIHKRQFFQK